MDGRRPGCRSAAACSFAPLPLLLGASPRHTPAALYKYYVLAPEQLSADLSVVSLEPGNLITGGSSRLVLGEYARGVIAAANLPPGTVLSGSALVFRR